MALIGETGKAWTVDEIELVVTVYFDLLAAELRGERPVKATRMRDLQRLMPARTVGSIERKMSDSVVWVARDLGDGAGYDIASFRDDGTPRHIEVKTTNLGARTPFYVTRWEVEVSGKESEIYSLYRVFDFRSDPRIYRLDGSVEKSARLEPSVFVGVPR